MSTTNLPCYGCVHSASSEPFPGKPSGERPCFFCVRNDQRDEWKAQIQQPIAPKHPVNGVWYDGSPALKVPMDCYIATDRLQQQLLWDQKPTAP